MLLLLNQWKNYWAKEVQLVKHCNAKETMDFSHEVTGVIKDYVYGDMYGQSAPVIFYYIPQAASLLYVSDKAIKQS